MEPNISIVSKLNGLGDSMCSMWCVEGFKQAGLEVDFFVRPEHVDVCKLFHDRVFPKDNAPLSAITINLNAHGGQMAALPPDNTPRIDWWWSRIVEQYPGDIPEGATPQKPHMPESFEKISKFENAVVIAPECCFLNRRWSMGHYSRLVLLLKQAGYEVIAFVEKEDSLVKSIKDILYHFGYPFEYLVKAIASSKLIIGNDSGPAHIAGITGVPCVPVHAIMPPQLLWERYSDFHPAFATDSCAGCGFQPDRGYHPHSCSMMCSALEGISAEEVFKVAVKVLDEIN